MYSIIAFALGPVGRYVALAALTSMLFFLWLWDHDRGLEAAIQAMRAQQSQERIIQMEKNNAQSRNLSEIERCRALAGNDGMLTKACE
jgi:hypothetical protein